MSYSIFFTPDFEKQFKRLCKKYKSLPNDLKELVIQLKSNPESGIFLGNNCYKVRLAIKSKNRGKSGGARVITLVVIKEEEVYLVTIYDKSERANISEHELQKITEKVKK